MQQIARVTRIVAHPASAGFASSKHEPIDTGALPRLVSITDDIDTGVAQRLCQGETVTGIQFKGTENRPK
jgi:hypothetical protein